MMKLNVSFVSAFWLLVIVHCSFSIESKYEISGSLSGNISFLEDFAAYRIDFSPELYKKLSNNLFFGFGLGIEGFGGWFYHTYTDSNQGGYSSILVNKNKYYLKLTLDNSFPISKSITPYISSGLLLKLVSFKYSFGLI